MTPEEFVEYVAKFTLWGEPMTDSLTDIFDIKDDPYYLEGNETFRYHGYSDDAVEWFEQVVKDARKVLEGNT